MALQQFINLLILPLILNLVLLASLITYAIRQRSLEIVNAFIAVCTCLLIWNISFIIEILSPALNTKVLFSNIAITFISLLIPSLFAMCAIQAGVSPRLQRLLWLTLLPPLATIAVLWSDPLHGLFRQTVIFASYRDYFYLSPEFGPWYYQVHLPYVYIFAGLSILVLIFALPRQQHLYRKQTLAMIISLLIPLMVSLATTFNIIHLPYYDLTPSALTISFLVIGLALFRYRLLTVVPLARDLVFEHMTDGVLVLDQHQTLVDLNPAARQIIQRGIGDSFDDFLAPVQLAKLSNGASETQISLGAGPDQRRYAARISAVHDQNRSLLGWAVLLHDITETLNLLERLQHLAIIDEMTGAYNRRHFMNLLNDEWLRARRYSHMMSLIMLDMDYFKQVNDTYGHFAGDAVLKEIIQLIRQNLRDLDRIGRFGGEEFIILLPETDLRGAQITAERLRQKIAAHLIRYQEKEIFVTASFGVAELPPDRDATSVQRFLRAADEALYVAKNTGRNRVATSGGKKADVQ